MWFHALFVHLFECVTQGPHHYFISTHVQYWTFSTSQWQSQHILTPPKSQRIDSLAFRSNPCDVCSILISEWLMMCMQVLSGSEDEGAWDSKGVAFPCAVVMEDGSCRLYYSWSNGKTVGASGIGMAVSEGTDWTTFSRYSPAWAPCPSFWRYCTWIKAIFCHEPE